MSISRVILAAAAIGVAATAACPSASAYSLGMWAGKPHTPSQVSLFSENWGGLYENQANYNYASWDLPIPLTYQGNLDVTVYASTRWPGSSTCSLQYGNTIGGGAGTSWAQAPYTSDPPGGWGNPLTWSINVPSDGNAELRCSIMGGDYFEGISY
jgi:hypothetical protein